MTDIDPATIETASLTHVGRVRATNQDSCGEFADAGAYRMLVLADGMGGHQGGEVASRMAVQAIGEVIGASKDGPEAALRHAFEVANDRILQAAASDPQYAGMGTTGVALLIASSGSAWVAHVGDSRAYVLRGGKMVPLTADHSYVAELQRRGLITADEAAVHPRRNEVLRSIGGEPGIDVEIRSVPALPGDCFLLCSDGLWGCVPEAEVVTTLLRERPSDATRTLVDLANQHGGPDNVTVQVAWIPDGSVRPAAEPAKDASTSRADWERALAATSIEKRQLQIRRVAIASLLLLAVMVLAVFLWAVVYGLREGAHGAAIAAPAPALANPPPARAVPPEPGR
jgi:protein phosphatase